MNVLRSVISLNHGVMKVLLRSAILLFSAPSLDVGALLGSKALGVVAGRIGAATSRYHVRFAYIYTYESSHSSKWRQGQASRETKAC